MSSSDTSLIRASDALTAVALLTRLPVQAQFERSAQAAWAYPLAGVVLALLAAAPTGVALWLGLPDLLAAVIWIATSVILSGAMHEDGLADTVDGLWGGWEPARRLEIMKDSHIGAYGVIALCLSLAARWAAVATILTQEGWLGGLIAVAVLSRASMPALMANLPHARDSGLSHSQGRVPHNTAQASFALAVLLGVLLTGWSVIGLALIAAVSAIGCGLVARAKIGGQTGDILGATQQICEIAMLCALTI